jgi:hypothetical protein
MKLESLKEIELLYVGTPYSKYEAGIEAAFKDAASLTGELLRQGLCVYSPISHTHPVAVYSGIDPLDLSIWLPFDATMMAKSDALIVAMMQGWEASSGIRHEMEAFVVAGKPVFFLNPETFEVDPLSGEERESILIAARSRKAAA